MEITYHWEGRLSDSRPQAFGYNGVSDWEVWQDEKTVFGRKPQERLFLYAFVGNFMETSCGD